MNDGGPAFPADAGKYHSGMSLRDYFAAAALQGSLANHEASWMPSKEEQKAGITWAMKCAHECYEVADAMIARMEMK